MHLVTAASETSNSAVAKCAKDAVRWGLRPGRPIWSNGYDKRFCYTPEQVCRRVRYVEQHNLDRGWPAKRWDFIESPPWPMD